MIDQGTNPIELSARRRFLPLLLLLFVGSGCAALIYEVVWLQLLQLVVGSSGVSLGILLGTFMGGMCLGSLAAPRFIAATWHPLRAYAWLELGIGVMGLVLLIAIPALGGVYTSYASQGLPGFLLRGILCSLCLLPPTILMGATLPAIARWVETSEGISWLGFFYGGNIGGAVFGCLLAGFYLLRIHDGWVATYVAVAINVAVALFAFVLAALTPHHATGSRAEGRDAPSPPGAAFVYVAIAFSGLSALGAEVVWTRQLSLLIGATVYTFAIILAVFLSGLGIGSSWGSVAARRSPHPRVALGWIQMALAAAIAWTAYVLARSLPRWPIDPTLAADPFTYLQLDLLRVAWAVLPPACLWGASFPLALAAAAAPGQDPARLVARVYAANTVGAIIGAAGFSILAVPLVGTLGAERLLIGIVVCSALLLLVSSVQKPNLLWVMASTAGAAFLIWALPGIPPGVVGFGRFLATYSSLPRFIYFGEGMNASFAVSEFEDGTRSFHVGGMVEASTLAVDMRLQRMLGHLPTLLHPRPRSVLIVGFGAGVTAGSFVPYKEIERIVICEIEPSIPRFVGPYFAPQNYDVVNDPRVEIVYDDARHFIRTTKEKFDIITSDPVHPWVKGAATLYTTDYFNLVKQHLNPGGVVTQWVPLYESTSEVVRSEIATFLEVFPNSTIWGNIDRDGQGYDVVLHGRTGHEPFDVDLVESRLKSQEAVASSLSKVGYDSAVQLLSTYAGQIQDLQPWLADAEINTDRNLRLQYLAGRGLNVRQARVIYDDILAYRRYHDDIFSASPDRKESLRLTIEHSRADP